MRFSDLPSWIPFSKPALQCLSVGAFLTGSMAFAVTESKGTTPAPGAEPSPVAAWYFDGADTIGSWLKKDKVEAPGPRIPNYPGFKPDNQAAFFPGKGLETSITVKDSENIRYKKGDSITMEAWVKLNAGATGEMYILGKGRLGSKEFGNQNQNYGLRLKLGDNGMRLGFIFSTHDGKGGKRLFHVWWSDDKENQAGSAWHHVALTYTFGVADSLRGYMDGKPLTGTWSFGGATDREPVVDGDDLLVGTGAERKPANSLNGWLDSVALYREILPAETLKKRYAFVPSAPPVADKDLPAGKVLVQICDQDLPASRAWPESNPEVTESYTEDVFGLVDLPQKYVSTGVRGDRGRPILVRATAQVEMPAGKHRLLLRSRGGSRLYIDGKQILTTPFPRGDTGGHGITEDQKTYLNLGPDFRFAPPGNRESWSEFTSTGKKHVVMLETIIASIEGNSSKRPELGETVIAISPEGTESWSLLSPGKRQVSYTDEGWTAYEAERLLRFDAMNTEARKKQRAKHDDYWTKRRQAAQEWLASTKEISVPALPETYPALNAIDHFIAARIAKVAGEYTNVKEGGVDYFRDVQPILETKCYDCHQGGKAKGDLRLDELVAALQGGESDGPAIVPGDAKKSPLIHRVTTDDEDSIMPPKGDPLTKDEIAILERWIAEGASWPEFHVKNFKLTPLSDDLAFLRRVTLDTTGVVPSEKEIQDFLADKSPERRSNVIDRLLVDPRWADHWMGYWQDVLAENPNIINPTLNNTGPFRWWIYESLLDDKPMDLFVTELVSLEGSDRFGGPAGFGVASQNDAPMAEKGAIVGSAFLGVEMKCARCHDAPAHISKQEHLFQLAAMLTQGSVKVPSTSSVPMDKLHEGGRKPLIQVTLPPGSDVQPVWPFKAFCDESVAETLAANPKNTRDRLATLITAPQNERFSQVMVNRIWQRFMGRGLVETVADWEKGKPTHPEFLQWLSREFVRSGYSTKAIARLILNSHAYQRATDTSLTTTGPLYVSPAPRRLEAEQVVDSLFSATGKPFTLEEVSLDIDSNRGQHNSITLGKPRRSWMLTSTSNERDRPSLSLPRLQAVATVLEAFGWRGSRQDPLSIRDKTPNTLQPAIISNGTMGYWLTVLSDDHGITKMALEEESLETFVDRLYLRLLTRQPTATERQDAIDLLAQGYENRVKPAVAKAPAGPRVRPVYFTWSNHLDNVANVLAVEAETKARHGDPPTERLDNDWRQRLEDLLWTVLNTPEWMFTP